MRVFNDRKMLVRAAVLMLGFAGCNPGRRFPRSKATSSPLKRHCLGHRRCGSAPRNKHCSISMSPEQQASFYRVLKAFREVKAEQAAAIERGTKADIQTLYADSTEEVFRKMLLKDPENTLGDR